MLVQRYGYVPDCNLQSTGKCGVIYWDEELTLLPVIDTSSQTTQVFQDLGLVGGS